MTGISRREALRVATLGGAAASLGIDRPAAASPAAAEPWSEEAEHSPPDPAGWVVKPFPNHRVTLGPSLFATNRDRILAFVAAYPADRMLAVFRANAGLDTRGAQPPGGWETADGNLRGHFAGHYLSCLALACAGTGDRAYRDKLDYLVAALGECQAALDARVGQPPPPTPPVQRTAGRSGGAVRLDGNAQYVALPAGIVGALTDCTIALWVNPTEITTWSRLFDFGTGTSTYMFLAASAGAAPRFAISTSGSGGEQRLNATAQLATGQWTHLAVTLSGGTGTFYVDGVPVASDPGMSLTPASLGATGNNWIGRSQYGDAYLRAAIDEFQIYDRALGAAEVVALASGDPGVGNVVSYGFDEAGGDTAIDGSGHGRDATLVAVPSGEAGPSHAGYLAAYPETQFILLERFATYPSIWAPWYTCHMIMRGLLDAHRYAGNEQALRIATGMAQWAHSRLASLPREQLNQMWRLHIAGEYNAMAAVLADIYALTGDDRHLATAKCFINSYLFEAAVRDEDILDGLHANQHIPQFLGYLEIFNRTGERDFHTAAAKFWDWVVPHRTYVDGGIAGSGELFGPRDVITGNIGDQNAETCPCYNMLKLSRALFCHDPDPKYMQYYERALYGQILASRQNVDSTTDPLLTYFVPMRPGSRRSYGNLGTCCGGTGLETHAKFQDTIYFRSIDGSTLYVNLYLASTLHWPERGFVIEQVTSYPTDDSGTSTLTVRGGGRLDLRLRVPYWAETGFSVRVNGVPVPIGAPNQGYLAISRDWVDGDTVTVAAPFTLRAERSLDEPGKLGIAYGPVPLVVRHARTSYLNVSFYRDFTLAGKLSGAIRPAGEPNTFTTNGHPLAPFYVADTAPYHAYLNWVEPRIIFASVDSGVPNYAGDDHRTFLDLIWAQSPFPSKGAFVRTVEELSAAWLAAGRLTRRERQAIIMAVARANLGP